MRGYLADYSKAGFTAIACRCERCANEAVLPLSWLTQKFGPATRLLDLESRMRCTGCNWKGSAKMLPSHQVQP